MKDLNSESNRQTSASGSGEYLVQFALVVLLAVWCFEIARPFMVPVLWAVIIAVTLSPLHEHLVRALKGRRIPAAILTTLFSIALLVIPAVYIGEAMVVDAQHLGQKIEKEGIRIPAPPKAIADLPLIGHSLEQHWREASQKKDAAGSALKRHLKPLGTWLLSAAAGMSFAIVQFVVAIFIAGFMLAWEESLLEWARRIVRRVIPRKGLELCSLAEATIRNVSRGVLGVAFIQALGAGIGFMLVGIPAAGLWALLCFILAILQIGVLPVTGPAALYVLFNVDLIIAIPFALWCAFIGLIDNFLKPLLMSHGLDTPLWVIVVGSIGGLLSSGVIGLFIGPVLLVLGYTLAHAWLAEDGRLQD